jgi:sugar/nucleoside kinase (ribokinase family)
MDFLYAHADFSGPAFRANASRREGDGGLSPGKLVFAEDLERFAGRAYESLLAELTEGAAPDSCNIGGPSIVSLIHAAQVLQGQGHSVRYYGALGTDETGAVLKTALAKLPLEGIAVSVKEGPSSRTDVLSDPDYDNGHGERTFIHLPGASSFLYPEDLEDSFFDAHIAAFGGTALLPPIHEELTPLLRKARGCDAVTIVNLVYDYRMEAQRKKWTLGRYDDAYPFIDILIADREEAVKTSGQASEEAAARWFLAQGTGAVVITQGAKPVTLTAGKGFFAPLDITRLPVCEESAYNLPANKGDTTGCGDNFAGGIIAAVAEQFHRGAADLREACISAIAAGGFARFTLGGVFYETYPGEKRERLTAPLETYRKTLLKASKI